MTRRTIPLLLAGTWSAAYAGLALGWLLGLGGYPFDPDPQADTTAVLDRVPVAVGATVLLVLAVAGAALITALALRRGGRLPVVAGLALAALLAVVLPDYRILATVAYLPIVLVLAVTGSLDPVVWEKLTSWPLVNLLVLTVAGTAFALAALRRRRELESRCDSCGHRRDPRLRADPDVVDRWGRIATYVAVLIPVGYALTRLAWFAGIPLGLSDDTYRRIHDILPIGAALGSMAIGGAVLTVGLIRPWGEVFPRWMPFLGGKTVPVSLAVRPALAVAVIVTSAGLMFVRLAITGAFSDAFSFLTAADWSAFTPELAWPVWGVALAWAALAYRSRRLRRCAHDADGTSPERAGSPAVPVRSSS